MTFHKPPFEKAPDPRILEHAYVACGPNLYYVLRTSLSADDDVLLEDCRTLQASSSTRERVMAECTLVRAAP